MGMQFNNGATNQRMHVASPPGNIWAGSGGAWCLYLRVNPDDIATTNGYIAHFVNSLNTVGTAVIMSYTGTGGGNGKVTLYANNGAAAVILNSASAILANGTETGLFIVCTGTSGGAVSENSIEFYYGTGSSTTKLTRANSGLGSSGSASVTPLANDSRWEWGNRADASRNCKYSVGDICVWRGTIPTQSEMDSILAGADPLTIATAGNPYDLSLIGGDRFSRTANADPTTLTGSPTAIAMKHPRAQALGSYPDFSSSLKHLWRSGAYSGGGNGSVVEETGLTANNCRFLMDVGGDSAGACHGYNTTTAGGAGTEVLRPRIKTASDGVSSKRLAFPRTSTSRGSNLSCNTGSGGTGIGATTSSGVTVAGIIDATTIDGDRQFADFGAFQIGMEDGTVYVRISGTKYYASASLYLETTAPVVTARPTPIVIVLGTVSGGNQAFTMYMPGSTVSLGYVGGMAAVTGNIARIGPSYTDNDERHAVGLDLLAYHNAAANSTQAAAILAHLTTVSGFPSVPRGGVVLAGSSTIGGYNAFQEANRSIQYQMATRNRERKLAIGNSGCGIARLRYAGTQNGTAFVNDEVVTQTGTGATAKVAYASNTLSSAGSVLILYSVSGAFNNTDTWIGAGGATLGTITANHDIGANSLWESGQYPVIGGAIAKCLADGPCSIVLAAMSNPILGGWSAAEVWGVTKNFATALRAALGSRLRIYIQAITPRSTFPGSNATFQAFNALARAGGHADIAGFIDLETDSQLDFSPSLGATDAANGSYYITDGGYRDQIHLGEVGLAFPAAKIYQVVSGNFAVNSGRSACRKLAMCG